MATPKVKMQLQPSNFASMLNLPADVELLSMYVTDDPLSVTLILMSENAFDDLYAPDGGFEPSISYKTVEANFFDQP